MRNAKTFGIQFIARMNKAKIDSVPIYVRITIDGHRIELSLKRWVARDDWNNARGRAKGTRSEIRALNRYLDEVKGRLVHCYQEMEKNKVHISVESLKNTYLGLGEGEYTLCRLIEYHNQSMKETLTWGTLKNYRTTEKYIKRFLSQKKNRSDIYLVELKYKFIIDFESFLRNWKPLDHQRPLTNNGVMKHLERLRKMINLAVKLEWLEKDPFAKYKLKFSRVEKGFLSKEDLEVIEQKEFKIPRMSYVRDLFVFSCYTGLAYGDVMDLNQDNVSRGIDGEKWLVFKRQKTKTPVRIPLLPKSLTIIDKYQNDPKAINEGALFPRMSNQKLNSYLKEIADVCGINKNLTFHLARHTFATTVTLANGVPIESVSKMLGHTKIATTQIYAKVVEKKVGEDMKALRMKLDDSTNEELGNQVKISVSKI